MTAAAGGVFELTVLDEGLEFDIPCDRDGCDVPVEWVARFAPCGHLRLLCTPHRLQCEREEAICRHSTRRLYCLTCDANITRVLWTPYRVGAPA